MRTTPYLIAASLLIAAPAVAQDNAVTATNDTAAAADATLNDPLATDANLAVDPANGVAADPMAAPATDPAMTDPAYSEPAEDHDDDRFPWGLLGLLGLAGLIPRKPRERRHDGAI